MVSGSGVRPALTVKVPTCHLDKSPNAENSNPVSALPAMGHSCIEGPSGKIGIGVFPKQEVDRYDMKGERGQNEDLAHRSDEDYDSESDT